ncbi:MAG: lytic transglycosylase domain-containing protein [Oscillospiraceae bacterium]|nr:lytic transglycosylase domain-containing protein [Oscillospiraceae bacterium]
MFKRIVTLLLALCIIALAVFWLIPKTVQKITYRLEYEEYVEKYSKQYGINKSLVYAVIKVESGFNPNAKSNAGAIGLMQMIEPTFDWISARLETEYLEFEDLYIPEVSIQYGCYMLSYLFEKYGSYELVAAAYHSGMSEVDSWFEQEGFNQYDVATYEGSKTRHYVDKVIKAYNNYKIINERKQNYE